VSRRNNATSSSRCIGLRTLKKIEGTVVGRNGRSYHYAYDSVTVASSCEALVLWSIRDVGTFCNRHFEQYISTHEVDPDDIVRLSDNELDFMSAGR